MERVLILRLSALGDVAMTLPVIYAVAREHGSARFTVVTRPFFRRLFINAPSNVDFIDFDPRGRSLMSLIRELKSRGFTHVADLHDSLRTRLIRAAFKLGGRTPVAVVNKGRRARRELTKGKSREFQRSYIDRYFDVFGRLGFRAGKTFTSLLPPSAREGVGLAPFARYVTKTYPPELMEKVARMLSERGIPVYLFGARGAEEEILRAMAARNPGLTLLAGTMTLEEELQAMSRLRVMVSMDSANMHLASLVATPVVSVWGSTIPQCGFLGYGQSAGNAVMLNLPCQACSVAGLRECPSGTLACLRELGPQLIVDKVLTLYGKED